MKFKFGDKVQHKSGRLLVVLAHVGELVHVATPQGFHKADTSNNFKRGWPKKRQPSNKGRAK